MGPVIGRKGKSKKQTNGLPIIDSDAVQLSVGAKARRFGSFSENSDFLFPSLPVTLTEKYHPSDIFTVLSNYIQLMRILKKLG